MRAFRDDIALVVYFSPVTLARAFADPARAPVELTRVLAEPPYAQVDVLLRVFCAGARTALLPAAPILRAWGERAGGQLSEPLGP